MKMTKIRIKNLFGIKEMELNGDSIEITGSNGVGKSSVLDAIRYALTNDSDRQFIIRQGEDEAEIIIETDTGLYINRKKRTNQADYKSVKDGRNIVSAPESFLRSLFSDLQINPVDFINLPPKEQNRAILDLIDFPWDLNWIREQFGEIPEGVDYSQNILKVLHDIQADNGQYFLRRQDLNRSIRNKTAFIEDIAKDIPSGYDAERWRKYDISAAYRERERIMRHNDQIERAKVFRDSYDGKVRGLQAQREMDVRRCTDEIRTEREALTRSIVQMKEQIRAAEDKLSTLDDTLRDKVALADAEYEKALAKLNQDIGVASEYVDKEPMDATKICEEIAHADAMRAHIHEYDRMKTMQRELETLIAESEDLDEKIETARTLPGVILQQATIPIDGLTVKDGIPLIHDLPVSNLSEGEKLSLCVDVALAKPNGLQIILMDGVEKLSEQNRLKLYEKCKEKGVQFIATRTTDDAELVVTTL